jgi:hypothetical protein
MSITRSSVHVSVPVERLIGDLILGSQTLDKAVAQLLPGYQKQITLNRFYTQGDNIITRVATPTTPADASTKDEKQIELGSMLYYDEFDPREFNQDWQFLWAQGPDNNQEVSAALMEAIMPSVATNFNATLEKMLWQGDVAAGTDPLQIFDGWEKLFLNDATVIDVTPQGPITAANVISIFEDMLSAAPANLRELGNPSFIVPNEVKYLYQEAARALDFKGNNITSAIEDLFGGYPIISVGGRSASNISFLNAGSGDDSELKVGVWADADRFNVLIDRVSANSDLFFIKIAAEVGVQSVYGKQIVNYIPV